MGRRIGSLAFIFTAFLLAAGIFILAANAQDFWAVMFMAPVFSGPSRGVAGPGLICSKESVPDYPDSWVCPLCSMV